MDLYLTGSIGYDVTESWFREQLAAAAGQPIRLLINSGGGSVFSGKAFISSIRDYSNRITAEITGLAASMASAIAVSCDKLIVSEQSVFMLHRAAMSSYGNKNDLEKSKNLLIGIDNQLSDLYATKTGLSHKKILEMMDKETWLFGEEILNLGFADELKDATETATALTLQEAKAQFAACYHAPTPSDIAAYMGTASHTSNNTEVEKLKSWILADPDNMKLAEVVNTAIAGGKSEASVLNELKTAVMSGGAAGLSALDLEAAKVAGMTPTEYKKAMAFYK